MKALWLTSWYPNKLDKMNGDFVQRHAMAAALFCSVQVIHLEADKNNILSQKIEIDQQQSSDLHETILLYKPVYQFGLFGKLISIFRYLWLYKKQIDDYISREGIPQIVHVHVPMKAGLLALWMHYRYKVKYVITEHWTIYHNQSADSYNKRNFLFKYATRAIFKNAAAFLSVSDNLGRLIQNTVAPVNCTVIPNAVNTDLFFYKPLDNDAMPFTFLHISTLNYQKNPLAILRCFHRFIVKYPGTKMIMAGEVSEDLKAAILKEKLSHPDIIFTGLISYAEVASLMQHAHALVMFSRYENLPCVILEALCCGMPVISSHVGGVSEVVNRQNGLLTDKYNEAGLLKVMEEIYENYAGYNREKISSDAMHQFGYDTIGREIYESYKTVLQPA